ncbi:MAG: hypothetical protein H6704_02555 [Myxococcales bacterium]|nr:hypothetical protein [Myxococcales bacterium]
MQPTRRSLATVRRAALLTLLLGGCLPVDDPRPECFRDTPCADGRACVAGRCTAPAGLPLAVEAPCLVDTACAASVAARPAPVASACLVSADTTIPLPWSGAGVGAAEAPPPDAPTAARLFLLEAGGEAACAPGGLRPDSPCEADTFCVLALDGVLAPVDAGATFTVDTCAPLWAGAPPAEQCDGGDQDCDGAADEGFDLGAACAEGVGACARDGVRVCAGPDAARCGATPGQATDELPNGLDDDCDGAADEGLAEACTPGDARACGAAVGVCGTGMQACVEGDDGLRAWGDCVDEGGSPLTRPGELREACNDLDDDCDGATDEGLTLGADGPAVGEPCSLGVGLCARDGRVVCVGGAPTCDAAQGLAVDEACNGLDDDCDGSSDEDFPLAGPCMVGTGGCARPGAVACGAGGEVICEGQAGSPVPERCGDGVDDDCDGTVDEGFADRGQPCTDGEGLCVVRGIYVCDPADATRLACNVRAPDPVPEQCNLQDDDCDGAVDEGFDLQTDPANCGLCGTACVAPNAVPSCVDGRCAVADCLGRFEDLDGLPENGCECNRDAPDPPDPTFTDADCDGVDGELDASIVVSFETGDDGAAGTPDAPVRTLARGLALAVERDQPVLLTVGTHLVDETLTVPAGVRLHGGYIEDDGDYTRTDVETVPTILTGAPVVLRFTDLDAPTLLDNLVVQGAAGRDGATSVAVVAENVGDHLTLRRVRLRAGVGGAGRPGADGAPGPLAAGPGQAGANALSMACPGCAGDPGTNPTCEVGTDGARGGEGGVPQMGAGDGQAGADSPAGALGGPAGTGDEPERRARRGRPARRRRPQRRGRPRGGRPRAHHPRLAALRRRARPGRAAGGGGGGGGGGAAATQAVRGAGGGGGGAGGCPAPRRTAAAAAAAASRCRCAAAASG